MKNSIFVTATQRGSGKSAIVLGLINLLERSIGRVGYFKPIAQNTPEGPDPDIELMVRTFNLEHDPEDIGPVTMEQVAEALAHERYDELVDRVLEAYGRIRQACDFVVCEGTDYFGAMASFEFNINADISKHLASPILLVANARECDAESSRQCMSMLDDIGMIKESFDERNCEFFGVILNRANSEQTDWIEETFRRGLTDHGVRLLGVLPRSDMLEKVRIEELVQELGAEVLMGHERLNVMVQEIVVAAMSLENVLARLPRGSLVITPGDREDILLGVAAAYVSPAIPAPAGVVMSGGLQPRKSVMDLILDLTAGQMPMLKMPTHTYDTALRVSEVQPKLQAHQRMRIEVVKGLVERHVNEEPLLTRAAVDTSKRRMTPSQFLHQIMERARSDRRHIVLPEGDDERILRAAVLLRERDVVDLTLLGDETEVTKKATKLGLRLDGIELIDPATSEWREPFAKRYIELRSPRKTPTWDLAFDLMQNVSYFGTMMVHEGKAHGMVSGAAHTTAHTLRPALEFIKTREGVSIASSVFFMCLPDMVLVYGDCAVNPNPTAEELADIALASAETAAAFGIEPYVAMLSYSTGESGSGETVDKVRTATELVRERNPDLRVEGPIQYDAAVDPGVAKAKLPGSRVAGAATVFIFPDLDSGNNTYKAVQRSARAIAVGPVMQGLRMPVNDLSRGCTVRDIVNTVAITAVQAQRSRP
jgi:phosphate acetyltransferase